MAKRKITACTAKRQLERQGIDFRSEFHRLRESDRRLILDTSRTAGYRKGRDARGSQARMYFRYLARKKGC